MGRKIVAFCLQPPTTALATVHVLSHRMSLLWGELYYSNNVVAIAAFADLTASLVSVAALCVPLTVNLNEQLLRLALALHASVVQHAHTEANLVCKSIPCRHEAIFVADYSPDRALTAIRVLAFRPKKNIRIVKHVLFRRLISYS